MSVRVVILILSQKTDPQAHNRKAHSYTLTKHSVKKKRKRRHAHSASGLYLRPGWLQSVLKSLPGVHSQPWTREEGWGGRNFKSKHRAYMGQPYTSATWGNKTLKWCKTRGPTSSYWSASVFIVNRIKFILSNQLSTHTHLRELNCAQTSALPLRKCFLSILNCKRRVSHRISPFKTSWACEEQDAGREREREHKGLRGDLWHVSWK